MVDVGTTVVFEDEGGVEEKMDRIALCLLSL